MYFRNVKLHPHALSRHLLVISSLFEISSKRTNSFNLSKLLNNLSN